MVQGSEWGLFEEVAKVALEKKLMGWTELVVCIGVPEGYFREHQ